MSKNKTTIITRKIEITPVYKYNPENTTEDDIKKEKKIVWDKIREVDKWSYRIANRVATECWNTWSNFGDVKRGDLPKIEPYKIFSEKLCVEYPELKNLKISSIASGITKEVYNKIREEFYDYINGKKTLPNYKSGYPMYTPRSKNNLESQNIYKSIGKLLNKENLDYIFTTPLGDFKLYFGRDRSNNKHVIDQCRDSIYELCDSKIQYDKQRNKLYLLATIRIPVETSTQLKKDKYLGVDLGIAIPIVASVYGEKNYSEFKNKIFIKDSINIGSISEFLRERTKLQSQRKTVQISLKSAKGGHGRKRKLQSLDNLRKKESNWVKTKNHIYSKQLIDFALKNNCGNIVLEDLSGFNNDVKNQKFIGRNWSYFELQTMIKNKAKKYNIEVFFVNPKNTSKGCSFCDTIDSENRKSQSEFECVNCGTKINADLNASRNIVKKYINNLEINK